MYHIIMHVAWYIAYSSVTKWLKGIEIPQTKPQWYGTDIQNDLVSEKLWINKIFTVAVSTSSNLNMVIQYN